MLKFNRCIHRKTQRAQRSSFFHLPLRGRQMKIRNHFVVWFTFHLYFYERKGINSKIFFPKGCCFSFSDLSAESEKGNLLCVLGASSAARGETIQSKRKLFQKRIRIYISHFEMKMNLLVTPIWLRFMAHPGGIFHTKSWFSNILEDFLKYISKIF